jgi:hypothetical protein
VRPGRPDEFGPLVAIWLWLTPSPQTLNFCQIIMATKWSRLSIPQLIQPKPSHLMVECGMFEYFDQADQSNLACWMQFGYG